MQDSNPPEDSQHTSTGHGRKGVEGEAGTAQDQEGITARGLPRAATAFPSISPGTGALGKQTHLPTAELGDKPLGFHASAEVQALPSSPELC